MSALTAAIGEVWSDAAFARRLAEHLAASGVLVPSALDDDAIHGICSVARSTTISGERNHPTVFAAVRTELERIAKGD